MNYKNKPRLIAEVDKKLKNCKLYLSGRHLSECYPMNSKSTMVTNIHRYLSGDIKNFNNHIYFWVELDIPITFENIRKIEQECIDKARAKLA